MPKNYFPVGN